MTAAQKFHAHLDRCPRCEQHPFDLCSTGAALLHAVACEGPGLPPPPGMAP